MRNYFIVIFTIIASSIYGQNQNISNGIVFDGEPYLAINPNNSQHVVVAWMSWINFANQFKIKTKSSFDGGQTWSSAYAMPHTLNGYSSADPSIAFNLNGEVFVCYIDFDGIDPPVNGGVYICKSSDGGINWDAPVEVINADYDGTKWPIDRPWIAIDNSNGINNGTVYVSSMNGNRTDFPFNPYLSVSNDGGATFSTNYLDNNNWLAGSLNPLPMCSPTVSSSGVFFGAYPSYVITQSFYPQYFLASSSDGGNTFSYSNIATITDTVSMSDFPFAKKGHLLINDPADANHLAFINLRTIYGDIDVFLSESTDGGITWSPPVRINDDPVGNDRMQDLVWGDFDIDGDLIISWRDRRNGADGTYQTTSEIWAAYRSKDSLNFAQNFQITNQTVSYDSVLEHSGNDFMCIKFQNDTLNAVWGDTRDGKLNIWFQQMNTDGTIVSTNQIASEDIPPIIIFPNPATEIINVKGEAIESLEVFDLNGKRLLLKNNSNAQTYVQLKLIGFNAGTYIIKVSTRWGNYIDKLLVQ